MKATPFAVVLCLLIAVEAHGQTEIRLKPIHTGDTTVSGLILPAPKTADGYFLEIHDVSGQSPQFLDRRNLGKVDPASGAFTVDFGEDHPLEPRHRITVGHTSGTPPTVSTTTPALAVPALRGRIDDGARVVEGQVLVRSGVAGVRIRVARSSLENQAGESPYEQYKTTTEINDEGAFSLTLARPLVAGQVVTAEALTAGQHTSAASAPVTVMDPGSWGRARAYFSGGVVFSKKNGDFSKQDLALSFSMDKSWLQAADYTLNAERAVRASLRARNAPDNGSGSGKFRFRQLNTFFDTRLTAVPVAAVTEGEAVTETPFVDSRKSALMQAGIYAPAYGPQTSWVHDGAVNALFIAPLFRGGIQTITEEPEEGAEADDVFNFMSIGFGLGHHKLSGTSNQTPELLSYLHVSWGKSEAFQLTRAGRTFKPMRMFVEGRLKIPETALQVGFDANLGDGADDVRFVFGTRFDIGEIFKRLKGFE